MTKTLLLGLGNDLLSDDSIGLRLAAVARERLAHNPNIAVAQTSEMGLSLLDFVVGFDQLLLVDAIQTRRAPPGFVHQMDGLDGQMQPTLSPHFLGLGEALALGRQLGLPVPKCVRILAIEVEDLFTVSEQLSPTLQAAFPALTEQIVRAAQAMTR